MWEHGFGFFEDGHQTKLSWMEVAPGKGKFVMECPVLLLGSFTDLFVLREVTPFSHTVLSSEPSTWGVELNMA